MFYSSVNTKLRIKQQFVWLFVGLFVCYFQSNMTLCHQMGIVGLIVKFVVGGGGVYVEEKRKVQSLKQEVGANAVLR